MPDRDLSPNQLAKILKSFGYKVSIAAGHITVNMEGSDIGWIQHLHKGEKDILPKYKVHEARRKLKLLPRDGITDKDFYSRY